VQNGTESDVDCGGSCPGCPDGKMCNTGADCLGAGCAGGVCAPVLLISQMRSEGKNGVDDDFVELYNPGSEPLTMDATWTLTAMSAVGGCKAPAVRYVGTGKVVPPHGHILLVGAEYAQVPAADAKFIGVTPGTSIDDAGAVWISHGALRTDTLCYYYDPTTQQTLGDPCSIPYLCPGTPISNLPHNGMAGPTSSVDTALERRPGGSAGNTTDTNNNNADFKKVTPADPHDLMSAPTP
jgi:hypothetical protein